MAIQIMYWQVGTTPDGAPIIERCLPDEPHPPEAVLAEQSEVAWINEIKRDLEEIDRKSIRALREDNAEWLEKLEEQAETLRRRLRRLKPHGGHAAS